MAETLHLALQSHNTQTKATEDFGSGFDVRFGLSFLLIAHVKHICLKQMT